MPLRCAPGDFCLVISGASTGAFVTVVERAPPHPISGLPAWICVSRCELSVSLVDQRNGKVIAKKIMQPGGKVCFEDTDLWPIKPPKPRKAEPAPPVELEIF